MASDAAKRERLRRAFDEHYDAISRYCHRRLPAADANDAAAQVFVVAWRKIDQMPTEDGTLPWLYSVARYQVGTQRRSARRLANLRQKLGGQRTTHEPSPEATIVANDDHDALLEAMARLSPGDQEILRLRVWEELTAPEIAVVLGCSVEAAKKRSARALNRLRRTAGVQTPQPSREGRLLEAEGDA